MSNLSRNVRPRLLLAGIFAVIAVLVAWDLLSDRGAGVDTLHLVIETLVLIIAAESEVALLILKGLGLGEIAALRSTSERTVRDQARAVYRKSGLANRASLSAFFLEDLLLPLADPSAAVDPERYTDSTR